MGRAQGIYTFPSQHGSVLLMVLNFAFLDGVHNGSALSILGRNPFFQGTREMPIVGGTGVFRYARGYALVKTVSLCVKTGDACGCQIQCVCVALLKRVMLFASSCGREMWSVKVVQIGFLLPIISCRICCFFFISCVAFHDYISLFSVD